MPSNGSERQRLRTSLGRTADCPPVEALERILDHAAQESPLQAHVDSCPHCKTELAMLKSFRDAEVAPADERAVAQITAQLRDRAAPSAAPKPEFGKSPSWIDRIFGNGWLRPAALALAGALVIAAVGLELRHPSPTLDNSAADGRAVFRSGSIVISSPVGDVQAAPEQIRWEAAAGAAKYQIHLMEVDHHELWTGDSSESVIQIPAAIRRQMVPLKTLLLEVDALDANGRKVAQSEVVRFRVLQSFYSH